MAIESITNNKIGKFGLCAVTMVLPFFLAIDSAFAHEDRMERAQTIAVSFRTGEIVEFAMSKGIITAINIRIGSSNYPVPKRECAKVHDVRFETVALLWNGVGNKSSATSDYFYVSFDMGPENAKAFGELPHIKLLFRHGKFAEGVVVKKTDERTWQEYDLCTGEEGGRTTLIGNIWDDIGEGQVKPK